MRQYVIQILLLFLLLTLSCLKRQDHEITAPEIPHYEITGTVYDFDSQNVLPNCPVILTVDELFHDVDFIQAADTTDSAGVFSFPSITPGQFIISGIRSGYTVHEEKILLQYESKSHDLQLPLPLVADEFYSSGDYGRSTGIHWKYLDKLARTVQWKPDGHGDYQSSFQRIDLGSFVSGFVVQGRQTLPDETPPLKALTFLGNYWAANNGGKPYIYAINAGDSKLLGKYDVPYEISDLAASDSNIWAASTSGHILKFGDHPARFEQDYLLANEKLGGIAWDRSALWTGENNENLVVKRDSELMPIKSYRPIYLNLNQKQTAVTPITYMAFDYYGRLWIANSSGYYSFKIPK